EPSVVRGPSMRARPSCAKSERRCAESPRQSIADRRHAVQYGGARAGDSAPFAGQRSVFYRVRSRGKQDACACRGPEYASGMKIPGSDGRMYDVRPGAGDDVYEVYIDRELVGAFEVTADDVRPKVHDPSGRVTSKMIVAIAQEFLEQGGGTMRIA